MRLGGQKSWITEDCFGTGRGSMGGKRSTVKGGGQNETKICSPVLGQ